ncbi:MAG: hypothetical protein GXP32_07735 [Kiritimatiellaeota bacterium]|nr:hypothetical protein [Kiritimatiellota bacterium]
MVLRSLHTCTDGIRINNGGYAPKGTGKVCDGSKCARNSIVGTYVPYIWLGGESREISVFGKNDKGWINAKGTSCQELVRSNGTLCLSLNLIAKRPESKARR